MASEGLTDALSTLSLNEPDFLLFEPFGDTAWIRETFNRIPRYLIRISTPNSDGSTDNIWVKSKAARYAHENANMDIFAINDKHQVAAALNRYLRWKGTPADADNLVSWTSSLLLAIQYIFYRHKHWKDGSNLENIKLCIIDTAALPKGAFLRDMDLIDAYQRFHSDLQYFRDLRTRKHRDFAGSYYFGEYLSQGALRIEGNCQIVSAQAIINEGLFLLQPEFQKSLKDGKPQWADEVIRLRQAFYYDGVDRQQITNEELQAVTKIAQLFGTRWKLPMAANLIALQPRRRGDSAILRTLRATPFTDQEREECSPSKTKVITYDTLPEVKQFDEIMQSVYADFCLTKLKTHIGSAEAELRNAIIYVHNSSFGTERPKLALDRSPTVLDTGTEVLLRRLDAIKYLSHSIQEQIQPIHVVAAASSVL